MRVSGPLVRTVAVVFLGVWSVVAPLCAWGAEKTPEEYREEEFAPWMWKLRRGETILFGSLPFSLFFITLGYDTIRYLGHLDDPEASRYAPWPFRSANPEPYTPAETLGVGIGVVVGTLVVAVADFVIGEMRARRSASP